MHQIVKHENELRAKQSMVMAGLETEMRSLVSNGPSILGFASEKYQISADISDYVLVPVVIMPSDLPNRNGIGFPLESLTEFNPEMGMPAYQTWKGKPTHIDHLNQDITKAKGIIFEAAIRPLKGYHGDIWKVVCLCGFDQSKDPMLCNAILSGERNNYSMGAYANGYQCSYCEARVTQENTCDHVKVGPGIVNFRKMDDGHIAYLMALGTVGFELSNVGYPAYSSASVTPKDVFSLK
jgi:hypothetical protein